MNNYQSMLSNLSKKIIENKFPYSNTILMGDNSIGKSELLRNLIQCDKTKSGAIYYLDAVNRQFSPEKVDFIRKEKKIPYNSAIIDLRIDEKFFNLCDSFNVYGTVVEGVEELYPLYEQELKVLMKEFLDVDINIRKNIQIYVEINGEERKLSSGFQALVRIFLELLYYQDSVVDKKENDRNIFIIDEVDEFLAPSNAYRLLEFIKSKFPDIDYLVTTHSADVVLGAKDFNIIIMYQEEFEILDSNDFDSAIETNALFVRTFKCVNTEDKKREIDNQLRRLFNNRISGELCKEDQKVLEDIKSKQLTKAQTVLVRQIEEW